MENIPVQDQLPRRIPRPDRRECAMQLAHPGEGPPRPDRVASRSKPRSRLPHHRQDRAMNNFADRDHCHPVQCRPAPDQGQLSPRTTTRRRRRRPAHRPPARPHHGQENPRFTREYLEATSATSATACRCFFRTAAASEKVSIDAPSPPSAPQRRHPDPGERNSKPPSPPSLSPKKCARPQPPVRRPDQAGKSRRGAEFMGLFACNPFAFPSTAHRRRFSYLPWRQPSHLAHDCSKTTPWAWTWLD